MFLSDISRLSWASRLVDGVGKVDIIAELTSDIVSQSALFSSFVDLIQATAKCTKSWLSTLNLVLFSFKKDRRRGVLVALSESPNQPEKLNRNDLEEF